MFAQVFLMHFHKCLCIVYPGLLSTASQVLHCIASCGLSVYYFPRSPLQGTQSLLLKFRKVFKIQYPMIFFAVQSVSQGLLYKVFSAKFPTVVSQYIFLRPSFVHSYQMFSLYIQSSDWFSLYIFPRSSLHSSPGLLSREPQVFFYNFPRSSTNNPLNLFWSIGPRSSPCRPSMYIFPGLPSAVSPICFAYRSPGLIFSISLRSSV